MIYAGVRFFRPSDRGELNRVVSGLVMNPSVMGGSGGSVRVTQILPTPIERFGDPVRTGSGVECPARVMKEAPWALNLSPRLAPSDTNVTWMDRNCCDEQHFVTVKGRDIYFPLEEIIPFPWGRMYDRLTRRIGPVRGERESNPRPVINRARDLVESRALTTRPPWEPGSEGLNLARVGEG